MQRNLVKQGLLLYSSVLGKERNCVARMTFAFSSSNIRKLISNQTPKKQQKAIKGKNWFLLELNKWISCFSKNGQENKLLMSGSKTKYVDADIGKKQANVTNTHLSTGL